MLTFTDEFIAFGKYCLPGVCALIPYWMIWKIERSTSDYCWLAFLMILFLRGIELIADLALRFMFGPSLKATLIGLGASPSCVGEIVLCVVALAFGSWKAWQARQKKGEEAEDHFPFVPFLCR